MADLTTLADAKAYAGVSASTDDTLLTTLVTAASAWVESWCGRMFTSANYSDTYSGRGGPALLLRRTPVTAIASLTVDGVLIPARASVGGAGWVLEDASIGLVRLAGFAFTRGVANVAVSYTAGYAVTPPEVAQAVNELVAVKYRRRDRVHLTSVGAAGETTSFVASDLTPSICAALQSYQRVVAP